MKLKRAPKRVLKHALKRESRPLRRPAGDARFRQAGFPGYIAGLGWVAAFLVLLFSVPRPEDLRLLAAGAADSAATLVWLFAATGLLIVSLLLQWLTRAGRLALLAGGGETVISLLLSLIPPLGVYRLFEGEGPVALLIGLVLAVNLLSFSRAVGIGGHFSRFLAALLFLLSAGLIVAGLLITPFSAYLAWFEILQGSGTGGLIPFVFGMTLAFFSAAFGAAVYRSGVLLPFSGTLSVTLLVFAIILQQSSLAMAALGTGFFALVLLFLRLFRSPASGEGLRAPLTGLGVALVLAIPAVLVSNVSGSRFINDYLSPLVKSAVARAMPDFPFLYNMPGYGFTMNEKRLGGNPVLSERAVFRVRGRPGEALYLRTRVFDAYTGQGWGVSEELGLQVEEENRPFFLPSTEGELMEIEVLIDFTNTLPHPLDLRHFQTPRVYETRFAGLATGFLLENPILRGETIRLRRGPGQVESENLLPYLAVPARLPEEVRALAQRLGAQASGEPNTILANIVGYLAENNSYSLDVGYADKAVDSTWDFLFNSRSGYCTNFATAYVILARLNGIPARYATGFLLFMPFDDGETLVTGYSAHAWPEVYLADGGWQTREATPPMNPDFMEEYFGSGGIGSQLNDTTGRQLRGLLGRRAPAIEPAAPSDEGYSLLFFLPIVIGSIAALILLLLRRRITALLAPGDKRGRIERELLRILRLLAGPDVPRPKESGWLRWSAEIIRRRPPREAVFIRRTTMIALRSFFGPEPPLHRDLVFLRGVRRRLRRK